MQYFQSLHCDVLSWECSALGGVRSLEQRCLEPSKFHMSGVSMIQIYGHVPTEDVAKMFLLSFQASLPGNDLNTRETLTPCLLL